MIDWPNYATFAVACIAVTIVPGPSVTVIIANSLRHGTKAGFASMLGTQAGLAIMVLVLAAGLELVIKAMGALFDIIRIVGAAYLIYLGARMLMNRSRLSGDDQAAPPKSGFFWQGLLVILSNPKVLLFFGAFIPQFIDPAGLVVGQTILLGATFMAAATLVDTTYAILAGRVRHWLTRSKIRMLEVTSGTLLVAGGIWLALTRRTA